MMIHVAWCCLCPFLFPHLMVYLGRFGVATASEALWFVTTNVWPGCVCESLLGHKWLAENHFTLPPEYMACIACIMDCGGAGHFCAYCRGCLTNSASWNGNIASFSFPFTSKRNSVGERPGKSANPSPYHWPSITKVRISTKFHGFHRSVPYGLRYSCSRRIGHKHKNDSLDNPLLTPVASCCHVALPCINLRDPRKNVHTTSWAS